jgi:hypothetical protein
MEASRADDESIDAHGRMSSASRQQLMREVDSLRPAGQLDSWGIKVTLAQPLESQESQGSPQLQDTDPEEAVSPRIAARDKLAHMTQRKFVAEADSGEKDMEVARCSYKLCQRALCEDSKKVGHSISLRTRAGGRDWTQYVGMVLCSRCYNRIIQTGSIEMTRKRLPLGVPGTSIATATIPVITTPSPPCGEASTLAMSVVKASSLAPPRNPGE